MTLEQKHLLGDEWVDDGTHVFESVSPVTGRVLWQGLLPEWIRSLWQ